MHIGQVPWAPIFTLILMCTNKAVAIIITGELVMSSEMELFREFYAQLVELLPMDVDVFITNLEMSCLLYGDACAHISSLSRQAEKAEYFLDHTILPSVRSDFGCRFTFLIMKLKDCVHCYAVKELATLISSKLKDIANCKMVLYTNSS